MSLQDNIFLSNLSIIVSIRVNFLNYICNKIFHVSLLELYTILYNWFVLQRLMKMLYHFISLSYKSLILNIFPSVLIPNLLQNINPCYII